jgi:hypothetical protein
MGRDWNSFEVHTRKSLYCYEQIVKGDSHKDAKLKEESSRKCIGFPGEHLSDQEQKAGKEMDSKGDLDEVSDRSEEPISGH